MGNEPVSLMKQAIKRCKCSFAQLKTAKRFVFIFVLFAVLSLAMSAAGCGAKTATKTTPKTTPKSVVSTTVPSVVKSTVATTSTTAKSTTTPALSQAAFPLLITAPQTYAEYTMPIYLTANDTIHLVWTVSGVGEHIRMSINTPDGQYVGLKTAGGFVPITTDKPCDQLNRSGSVVLKPAEEKWIDGYYIFHPYIADKDPTVNVKILYWIEHSTGA